MIIYFSITMYKVFNDYFLKSISHLFFVFETVNCAENQKVVCYSGDSSLYEEAKV